MVLVHKIHSSHPSITHASPLKPNSFKRKMVVFLFKS